jgi:enoyl-CoA hydratase/carnithine racemase
MLRPTMQAAAGAVARAGRVLAGRQRRSLASLSSPMATQEVVPFDGHLFRQLTLNRQKALNAVNLPMIRELHRYFNEYEPNSKIHAIVLRGAGDRAFCAGGDVKALYDFAQKDDTRADAFQFFAEEYLLNYKLATSATPVISFIDGIVMGGGVGLSVPGLYRVATPTTLFAMPETAIGFFPDVGGSFYLPRLQGGAGVGAFLGLTGARLKGIDTLHAGVATHFVVRARVWLP